MSAKKLSELFKIFSRIFYCYDYLESSLKERIEVLNPDSWTPSLILPSNARNLINFFQFLVECYKYKEKETIALYHKLVNTFEHIPEVFKIKNNIINLPRNNNFGWLSLYLWKKRHQFDTNYWHLNPYFGEIIEEEKNQLILILQAGANITFQTNKNLLLDFLNRISLVHAALNAFFSDQDFEKITSIEKIKEPNIFIPVAYLITPNYYRIKNLKISRNNEIPGCFQLTKERKSYGSKLKLINTMIFIFDSLKRKQEETKYYINLKQITQFGNWMWIKKILDLLHEEINLKDQQMEEEIFMEEIKKLFVKNPADNSKKVDLALKKLSVDLFPAVKEWQSRAEAEAEFILDCFRIIYSHINEYFFVNVFAGLANLQRLIQNTYNRDISPIPLNVDYKDTKLLASLSEESTEDEGLAEQEDTEHEILKDISKEWQNSLNLWKEIFLKTEPLPTYVLSEASKKFCENLVKIYNEIPKHHKSLGFMLSRWTLALWQFLLVEEYQFRKRENLHIQKNRSVQNILFKDGIFENLDKNKEKFKKILQECKFTTSLIACPILLATIPKNIRDPLLQILKEINASEGKENASEGKGFTDMIFQTNYEFKSLNKKYTLDIYEVLCALMISPSPRSEEKVKIKNEETFKKGFFEFCLKYYIKAYLEYKKNAEEHNPSTSQISK